MCLLMFVLRGVHDMFQIFCCSDHGVNTLESVSVPELAKCFWGQCICRYVLCVGVIFFLCVPLEKVCALHCASQITWLYLGKISTCKMASVSVVSADLCIC